MPSSSNRQSNNLSLCPKKLDQHKAQKTFADTAQSWSVDVAAVSASTFDLSVKNPNGGEVVAHRSPQDIMDEIAALDVESAQVLEQIRTLLHIKS